MNEMLGNPEEARRAKVRKIEGETERVKSSTSRVLEESRVRQQEFTERLGQISKSTSVEDAPVTVEDDKERVEARPWGGLRFPDARYAMLAIIAGGGMGAAEMTQSLAGMKSDVELGNRIELLEAQIQAMKAEAQAREQVPDARELLSRINLRDIAPTVEELLVGAGIQTPECMEIIGQLEVATTDAGDVVYRFDRSGDGFVTPADFDLAVHASVGQNGYIDIDLLGHVPRLQSGQTEAGLRSTWGVDQELLTGGVYVASDSVEHLLAQHDGVTEGISRQVANIIQTYLDELENYDSAAGRDRRDFPPY